MYFLLFAGTAISVFTLGRVEKAKIKRDEIFIDDAAECDRDRSFNRCDWYPDCATV